MCYTLILSVFRIIFKRLGLWLRAGQSYHTEHSRILVFEQSSTRIRTAEYSYSDNRILVFGQSNTRIRTIEYSYSNNRILESEY